MGQFMLATRFRGSCWIVTVFVQSTPTPFMCSSISWHRPPCGSHRALCGLSVLSSTGIWRRLEVTSSTTSTVLLVVVVCLCLALFTLCWPLGPESSLVGLFLFLYRTKGRSVSSEWWLLLARYRLASDLMACRVLSSTAALSSFQVLLAACDRLSSRRCWYCSCGWMLGDRTRRYCGGWWNSIRCSIR